MGAVRARKETGLLFIDFRNMTPSTRFNHQPVLPIVHAVRMADQLSANQDNNRHWPKPIHLSTIVASDQTALRSLHG